MMLAFLTLAPRLSPPLACLAGFCLVVLWSGLTRETPSRLQRVLLGLAVTLLAVTATGQAFAMLDPCAGLTPWSFSWVMAGCFWP